MMAALICTCLVSFSFAQDGDSKSKSSVTEKTEKKPFRVLTNGKRITLQSNKNIRTLLVWTSTGHRIIEQQELNAANYSFETPVKEKIFFVMLELDNGKRYTEKIGVQ